MENKEKDFLHDLKSGVQELGKQVGKFLGDTFQGDSTDLPIRIDIYTTDSQYIIELELAGMEKSQVSMQIKDDTLILKGNKSEAADKNVVQYFQKNRKFGEFNRHFELPANVQASGVKAKFENGLLSIRFPLLTPTPPQPEDNTVPVE